MTPAASLPAGAQLLLGAALAVAINAFLVALTVAGVPLNLWAWFAVFIAIWALVFVAMKKRLMVFLVGFIITGGSIYLILAARGFRLWW